VAGDAEMVAAAPSAPNPLEDSASDEEAHAAAEERRRRRREREAERELDEEDYALLDEAGVQVKRPLAQKRRRLRQAGAGGEAAPRVVLAPEELKARLFGSALSDEDEVEAVPAPAPVRDVFDEDDEDEMGCAARRWRGRRGAPANPRECTA